MLVRHWMAKDVCIVRPDTSLLECKAILKELKIGRLPVVDKDKHILGILSENDMKEFQPLHSTGVEILEALDILSEKKAKEVMTPDPYTVNVNDTLEDAAVVMIDKGVSCLPVIDDNKVLVGILTEWDIFKSLVSITGVNQPGIMLSFEVENKPGTLRALLDILKQYDVRIIAVLSKIRKNGSRLISIRCHGKSKEIEDKMITELAARGTMRYWARDKVTHEIKQADGTSAADGVNPEK